MFTELVRLPSGRLVDIEALDAGLTYGGILEGGRFSYVHDRIVTGLARRAATRFPEIPVAVVSPVRTVQEDGPSRGPAREQWLPKARIMALCRSDAVDQEHYDSHLVAVWLQEDFTITRHSVEAALQTVDWDATARDSTP